MGYVVVYALGLVCGFVGGYGYCLIRARQADAKLAADLRGTLGRAQEIGRMLDECKQQMADARREN
jgi:hypothetical protein